MNVFLWTAVLLWLGWVVFAYADESHAWRHGVRANPCACGNPALYGTHGDRCSFPRSQP